MRKEEGLGVKAPSTTLKTKRLPMFSGPKDRMIRVQAREAKKGMSRRDREMCTQSIGKEISQIHHPSLPTIEQQQQQCVHS
jgi:hypothetical protein